MTDRYDLIVVGGGIYGLMLALEATRRGRRPLLLERATIGGATTYASLRILHGGLRYLQNANLRRALESIRERRWWLRQFPELVHPLPCLLPLYGDGLHRPEILRLGLMLNSMLCRWHDDPLPPGRILDARATSALCPTIGQQDLKGGALWYDGFVPDISALCQALAERARRAGATICEQVEAVELLRTGTRISGVRARLLAADTIAEFAADLVVNAAGPWSRQFITRCGLDAPGLLPAPLLAWNVAFDRPAPSDHALAVRARRPGAQTYFLVPWRGRLLAGTAYALVADLPEKPAVNSALISSFIAELNRALPRLELRRDEIAEIFAGILPAARAGRAWPGDHTSIIDHGRQGFRGLLSLAGVKLTVAPAAARRLLDRIWPAQA